MRIVWGATESFGRTTAEIQPVSSPGDWGWCCADDVRAMEYEHASTLEQLRQTRRDFAMEIAWRNITTPGNCHFSEEIFECSNEHVAVARRIALARWHKLTVAEVEDLFRDIDED